ncbi:uncharacterized protein LOC123300608 [Chrysoperla carnea]|uniref:uncharacterized protein LOC123300608 n=1 Tax=Chrysoperla carnea TaxID=189513 RepID=UPI001D072F8B|nr:uncharacterized protein LOC123300608 [Chrysoperla carnea]
MVEQTANEISNLVFLKDLTLIGNPIVKNLKYRDRLIVKSNQLKTIDDKEVRENTRVFLKNFEKGKLNNLKPDGKYEIPLPEELSKIPLGLKTELKKSLHNIAAGRNLSTAVTVSETRKPAEMNPDNNITATGEFYVPWNKLPKTVGVSANSAKRQNNSPITRTVHTLQA